MPRPRMILLRAAWLVPLMEQRCGLDHGRRVGHSGPASRRRARCAAPRGPGNWLSWAAWRGSRHHFWPLTFTRRCSLCDAKVLPRPRRPRPRGPGYGSRASAELLLQIALHARLLPPPPHRRCSRGAPGRSHRAATWKFGIPPGSPQPPRRTLSSSSTLAKPGEATIPAQLTTTGTSSSPIMPSAGESFQRFRTRRVAQLA
jgi:hypothetical protein